jgi:hypothetical protein
MARPNLLQPYLPAINDFFDHLEYKSFTFNKVYGLLDDERHRWGVPYNKATKDIIAYLLSQKLLLKTEFGAEPGSVDILTWKLTDLYTVISGLRAGSYFAYYTALSLNGLTQQIPKTFYLNSEHSSVPANSRNELTQEAVDKAFAGQQRRSDLQYAIDERRVILTNSRYTGRLGVVRLLNEQQDFYYTDLERTLIDITARPAYSGGVSEILQAYELAKEQLDVQKLISYLKEMNFTYPYEQAVGFYLERSGYPETYLDAIKIRPAIDFYLSYGIRNKEFSDRWHIWYPKGL